MLEHSLRPLAVSFGLTDGNDMIFNTVKGKVRISGCNEILPGILSSCNGLNRVEDVLEPFQDTYEKEDLERLVKTLVENKIIVDSRHIYELAQLASQNPMNFHYNLTVGDLRSISFVGEPSQLQVPYVELPKPTGALVDLLQQRASNRALIENPSCSLEDFSSLLWCTLGRVDKDLQDPIVTGPAFNIPSGGRVYSTELFVFLTGEVEGLKRGLYHYDKTNHKVGFVKEIENDSLSSALDLKQISVNSLLCVLVVTSKVYRSTQKYSNRGYRYINLEAGHSAQNAYLSAAELGLGILEYGGFHDSELAEYIGLDAGVIPLISLLVGKGKPKDETSTLRIHS